MPQCAIASRDIYIDFLFKYTVYGGYIHNGILTFFPFLSSRQKQSLLEEGSLMSRLNHPRIVKLLGIILEDGDYSLVMELIPKGNLLSMLEKVISEWLLHLKNNINYEFSLININCSNTCKSVFILSCLCTRYLSHYLWRDGSLWKSWKEWFISWRTKLFTKT